METGASMVHSVALNVLATLQLASHHVPDSAVLNAGAKFDYIIVGGGTAGCVLANRLTENPNIQVALLEAGPQQPSESIMPGTYALIPGTAYEYKFPVEQDDYTGQELQDKVPQLNFGKMLSGTSGTDTMVHIRSNRHDFDGWVEDTNDQTWSYDEMLKYYKKSERLEDSEVQKSPDADNYGKDGPIGLTKQPFPENEDIIRSFQELGAKSVTDFNENNKVGVSQPLFRIYNGTRQSTSEAYLVPHGDRQNLHVFTLTSATRIIFDQKNNAIGVKAYNSNNRTVSVYAKKEVILSAGTIKSAHLLLLSGVGPQQTLRSWGVDVKSDLPVGQAIRNQIGAVIGYKLNPADKPQEAVDPHKFPVAVTVAQMAVDRFQSIPDYQAYNMFFPKNSSALVPILANEFKYTDNVVNSFHEANQESDLLVSVITHLQPVSTGIVALQSNKAWDDPWIYLGTFRNPQDLQSLGKYMYDFSQIAQTDYFEDAEAKLVEIDLEYCNHLRRNSLDFFNCYGRSMSLLPKIPVGTCPIGKVVDTKLKVIGVNNLRVVDASVFPRANSGQVTNDVVALAEKAADLIKADQQS